MTQFISPSDDLTAFIVQMIVLCSSLIIGIGGAISKVVGYCRLPGKKEEENAVRALVLSIFFDYLWPIIGIYPAIFVWFEYKAAEDLMYNPIPFIINLFLYFGIIKVVFFFIKGQVSILINFNSSLKESRDPRYLIIVYLRNLKKFYCWMQIGTSENGLKTIPLLLRFSSIMTSLGTLDGAGHLFLKTYVILLVLVSYFVMHSSLQWFTFMLRGIWLLKIKSILRIFGFPLLRF